MSTDYVVIVIGSEMGGMTTATALSRLNHKVFLSKPNWSSGLYLFVIFYAFLVFLMCSRILPTDFSGYEASRDISMRSEAGFLVHFVWPKS